MIAELKVSIKTLSQASPKFPLFFLLSRAVGQAGGDFLLISDLTTVPRENELIFYLKI